jgi:hypothetical protein
MKMKTKPSFSNNSINQNTLNRNQYLNNQNRAKMVHICQSILVIATLACSTLSVDAFSTSRQFANQNRIQSRESPMTQIHAFIIHHNRKSTSTSLFATKKEAQPRKKRSGSDEDEWNALLASFQMYKAAYGDLKVPSRFVVPSMPPWPGEFILSFCSF